WWYVASPSKRKGPPDPPINPSTYSNITSARQVSSVRRPAREKEAQGKEENRRRKNEEPPMKLLHVGNDGRQRRHHQHHEDGFPQEGLELRDALDSHPGRHARIDLVTAGAEEETRRAGS